MRITECDNISEQINSKDGKDKITIVDAYEPNNAYDSLTVMLIGEGKSISASGIFYIEIKYPKSTHISRWTMSVGMNNILEAWDDYQDALNKYKTYVIRYGWHSKESEKKYKTLLDSKHKSFLNAILNYVKFHPQMFYTFMHTNIDVLEIVSYNFHKQP